MSRSPSRVKNSSKASIVADSGASSVAKPPVAITRASAPISSRMRATRPSTSDDVAEDEARLDRVDGVLADDLRRADQLDARQLGGRASRARRSEMPSPGEITPPRYSPFAETQSKVVAVPKSTTMQASW